MDLLWGGVIHFGIIWGAHLGGCIHWFGEIFWFGGRGVTKTTGSSLFGVEPANTCPEMSDTT